MASSTIPGVYAAALIELARERGTVEAVVASAHALVEALTPEVLRPLDDPRVGKQRAKQAVAAATAQQPKEVHDLLQLLVDRNRLVDTAAILAEAIRLYEQQEGIVHVQVTLAVETAPAFKQEMLERIRTKNGPKAVLDLAMDPELVAGFTSRIGDRYVDASARRVFDEMCLSLLATPLPDALWSSEPAA